MNRDYSAYASGQVFYSRPGFPAFPVRIASEVFSRSVSLLNEREVAPPYVLYDPCCGSAQFLTTLCPLSRDLLSHLIGSDIRIEAVALAQKNLDLLTVAGMEKRINELRGLIEKFGKESHKVTLQHAISFRDQLMELRRLHPIATKVFQADVLKLDTIQNNLEGIEPTLVITDIPYGQGTVWASDLPSGKNSPAEKMLETLLSVLPRDAVVAVASDRQQKVRHPAYIKRSHLKVGKRRVVFLTLQP